jgi:hypothetical protein
MSDLVQRHDEEDDSNEKRVLEALRLGGDTSMFNFIGRLAKDRDEWKRQHENLLAVKAADNAALSATIERLTARIAELEGTIGIDRIDAANRLRAATDRLASLERPGYVWVPREVLEALAEMVEDAKVPAVIRGYVGGTLRMLAAAAPPEGEGNG